MKSAIAVAAFSAAVITLQGCGGDGTTTAAPAPCTRDPTMKWSCPTSMPMTTFQDMGDGDTKNVTIEDGVVTISGDNWTTSLVLDQMCSGSVNFTVPGKVDHPDGNLTLVVGSSYSSESSCSSPNNYVFSFSMPNDTTLYPLNQWVESSGNMQEGTNYTCIQDSRSHFYADMHDGDQKVVVIDCSAADTCSLKITPENATETWNISATIDKSTCSGMVDFNVSGKPNPPPKPLQATFRVARWHNQPVMVDVDVPTEYFIEFALDGSQVNQWVEVKNPGVLPTTTGLPTTTAPANQTNQTTTVPGIIVA